MICFPNNLSDVKCSFQAGALDITLTLDQSNILELAVTAHALKLNCFEETRSSTVLSKLFSSAASTLKIFKIIVENTLFEAGVYFELQFKKFIDGKQSDFKMFEKQDITFINSTPYEELSTLKWTQSKHSQATGKNFTSLTLEVTAQLWHMYQRLNPQFMALHQARVNDGIFGNINIANAHNSDGYFFPLSPLNPVYFPSINLHLKLQERPFIDTIYIHGEETVAINMISGIVSMKQTTTNIDTDKVEENLYKVGKKMSHVSMTISLIPNEFQKSCFLRLATGISKPVMVNLPWSLYHFRTYSSNKNGETSSIFSLNFTDVPSPNLIDLSDINTLSPWKRGMNLEITKERTYAATISEIYTMQEFQTKLPYIELEVHIDGSERSYQERITSNNLHPCGYAHKNSIALISPKSYRVDLPFSWNNYLRWMGNELTPNFLFNSAQIGNLQGSDHDEYEQNEIPSFLFGKDESALKEEKELPDKGFLQISPKYGDVLEIEDDSGINLNGAVIVDWKFEDGKPRISVVYVKSLEGDDQNPVWLDADSSKIHPIGYHDHLVETDPVYKQKKGSLQLEKNITGSSSSAWKKLMTNYNFKPAKQQCFNLNQLGGFINQLQEESEDLIDILEHLSSPFTFNLFLNI
jgi:hypothetical protein